MKKLLFSAAFLSCLFTKAQDIDIKIDSLKTVEVNILYIDAFNEFIADLECHGISKRKIDHLIGIYVAPGSTMNNALGITFMNRVVQLNAELPIYLPTLRKAVMYHELGHAMGIDHSHDGPYLMMSGSDVDEEFLIKNWNKIKEEFFVYIKDKL